MRGAALLVASVVLAAGCGGSDEGGGVPSELVGTYTTTIMEDAIPADAPPELEAGAWELVIAEEGGPDGGPALSINHPEKGNLEAPALTVEGDRLVLNDEECAAGGSYTFHDNEYRWVLEGSTLTLTTIVNDCSDRVAETILTSEPWTKSG